ncbi:MAG TPA: Holliday junction branch migration protein RuvA [Firmicutes bacterium]|nr:Holliday junction branch migration protein RuvA [Bacillota bacterium]
MFYSLTGTLILKDTSIAVIDCGGVAFRCYTTLNTIKELPQPGETVTLYTYLNVKEDALDLYGFYTSAELDIYKILIGVNGVGPKVGIAILSAFTPDRLSLIISSGDSKSLTQAGGVGPKLAQRIVLELKDKVSGSTAGEGLSDLAVSAQGGGAVSEAINALTSLGYTHNEATNALAGVNSDLSVEELIKTALKNLAGRVI